MLAAFSLGVGSCWINRALELFTKAPHHWHTLCKNARQKAELFSIERTVAQLEELYQEQ